ncbi:hypothetical protein [endosymbiont GvMRE of Glomus versiforme]|uniref:hypothetical protein n=1 Tax=endosymbiont GvMRE of Glomus versiforme TaxID=2039283 RepID=UPI0011C4AAC6|nr:hypothetical protein [endosymbiont GvMRE of Glomus versiforme]
MDNLTTIQGILTSRIEEKNTKTEPYYYGFFQVPNQTQEIPVVFKSKPSIPKGSQVELKGHWANSNSTRPSFTCHHYQILSNPPPLTTKSLREQIQPLLSFALEQKQSWNQKVDFLFKKLEELKRLEELNKFGSQYLQAHLLLKNTEYSAFSEGKLIMETFTQKSYLERMASELEDTERRIKAIQNKEANQ